MTERLAVIGGDAGGMSAAAQARRRRSPDDLEIVAFERGRFTSYSACGIPYWIGDVVGDRDALIARSPEEHRDLGIDVQVRHEVTAIDIERRTLTVVDLDADAERTEGFDQFVLAPGAVPIRPDLPGIDADGIHGVQTLEDGDSVNRDIDTHRPERAVIVGAGYIGIEMAEALTERGLDVTVVDAAEHPMRPLDDDVGGLLAESIRAAGIALHLGEPVEGFELDGGRVRSVVTAGGELAADIVVLGMGVVPDTRLAREAGIEIGVADGIAVDQRCRTSADGVWAAGDATEKFHRIARKPVALPLGTHANKQGRVIGINIGGGYATFPGVVGTAASKVCAAEVALTGLTARAAEEAGFSFVTATVQSTTRASYYPGASPLTVKVVAEERSGRLLGAQIIGQEGAGKRIDAFATALWNDMTVDDLVNLDLSYAPPFAPLWDPVLIAARKAWQAVEAALPG